MKATRVVTGLGAVTSMAQKIEPLWEAILAGQSGIHELREFDTEGHKVKFGGDIHGWNTEGYVERKEVKRIDRFTQLAMVAGIDAVTARDRL